MSGGRMRGFPAAATHSAQDARNGTPGDHVEHGYPRAGGNAVALHPGLLRRRRRGGGAHPPVLCRATPRHGVPWKHGVLRLRGGRRRRGGRGRPGQRQGGVSTVGLRDAQRRDRVRGIRTAGCAGFGRVGSSGGRSHRPHVRRGHPPVALSLSLWAQGRELGLRDRGSLGCGCCASAIAGPGRWRHILLPLGQAPTQPPRAGSDCDPEGGEQLGAVLDQRGRLVHRGGGADGAGDELEPHPEGNGAHESEVDDQDADDGDGVDGHALGGEEGE